MQTYEAMLEQHLVPYVALTYESGDEYIAAIRDRRPLRRPKWSTGQFVYSFIHHANVPVVAVYWDRGIGSCRSGWRINTPGHGGFEDGFTDPHPTAPTFIFACRPNGHTWDKIGEQPPLR